MITLKKILQEMDICLSIEKGLAEEKEIKRAVKRLGFLRLIRNYMETEPSKDFVESEIRKNESRVNSLVSKIKRPVNMTQKELSKYTKQQEAFLGVTKIRKQLTVLRKIYSGNI